MDELLKEEAKAFDLKIQERINAGHIPDLRRVKTCHYFYNNVWREPLYVNLSIWPRFSFILKHIKDQGVRIPRVLEIGCGAGFTSLELARNGCNVTGIDISKESIKVAKKFANENPFKEGFGYLKYHIAEIFDFLKNIKNAFDTIVFYGILHHFTFFELMELCPLMRGALKKDGIVVGYEPAYDWFNEPSATILLILKKLLRNAGNFFEDTFIHDNEYELMAAIRNTLLSGKQITENLTKKQSIKDFSSGYADIITALTFNFKTIAYENDHGFFELLVGGLRGKKEEIEKLARFIDVVDKKLVEFGSIHPLSFRFAGKKRDSQQKK